MTSVQLRTTLARLSPLLFLLSFSTCCGPTLTVNRQANPNPVRGQRSFQVETLRFVDLMVNEVTEAAHLEKQSGKPDYAAKWEADKAVVVDTFDKALRKGLQDAGILVASGDAKFTLRVQTSELDTGYYRVPAPTICPALNLTLSIVDGSGKVADEILLRPSPTAGLGTGALFREIAELSGKAASEYVAGRVK